MTLRQLASVIPLYSLKSTPYRGTSSGVVVPVPGSEADPTETGSSGGGARLSIVGQREAIRSS